MSSDILIKRTSVLLKIFTPSVLRYQVKLEKLLDQNQVCYITILFKIVLFGNRSSYMKSTVAKPFSSSIRNEGEGTESQIKVG